MHALATLHGTETVYKTECIQPHVTVVQMIFQPSLCHTGSDGYLETIPSSQSLFPYYSIYSIISPIPPLLIPSSKLQVT